MSNPVIKLRAATRKQGSQRKQYSYTFLACSMGIAWFAAVYPASLDDKQFPQAPAGNVQT